MIRVGCTTGALEIFLLTYLLRQLSHEFCGSMSLNNIISCCRVVGLPIPFLSKGRRDTTAELSRVGGVNASAVRIDYFCSRLLVDYLATSPLN